MRSGCLLDTSFLIRLLSRTDKLHVNARDYFKYFLDNGILMSVSTISIAEFCVKGGIEDLPLKNIRILPFNFSHAILAGELAEIMLAEKDDTNLPRAQIINDIYLFAQAETESKVSHYVTSDSRSKKMHEKLTNVDKIHFKFVDINTPCNETFGYLPLE